MFLSKCKYHFHEQGINLGNKKCFNFNRKLNTHNYFDNTEEATYCDYFGPMITGGF